MKVISLIMILFLVGMDVALVYDYIRECNTVHDYMFYGVITAVLVGVSSLPLCGWYDELKD